MLAKDIMRKDVVTVPPFMTLKELALLLDERRITGAPVVDGQGKILGVVSQTDLVRADREAAPGTVASYHRQADEAASSAGFHLEDPDRTRVEQIMTPGGLSLEESASAEEVARLMLGHRIHRILITRAGRLCGIVTSMDMVRAYLDAVGGKEPGGGAKTARRR